MQRLIATLAIAGLLLLRLTASAQQVIWSEDFEYLPQINFVAPWGTVNGGWGCNYVDQIGTVCFPPTGNKTRVAGVSDYLLPTGTPALCGDFFLNQTNVLLMTPYLSLAGVQHARLRYDSYFLQQSKGGKTESATVEISTDSGRTWTVMQHAPVCDISKGRMLTSYVNLDAYAGLSSAVRLGFRYTDSAQYMTGWMIDNMSVFVPADNDIALTKVIPDDTMLSYYTANTDVPLNGVVTNFGTTAVTAFTVNYQLGTGPVYGQTISGLNMLPLDTFSFTHAYPFHIPAAGRYPVKIWVSIAGDAVRSNDSQIALVHGAAFLPRKKVVVEEGTGTWNTLGPRGYVYMHALDATDNPPIRISVHSGDSDAMEEKDYSDYLYYLNQNFTPFFLLDRRGPVRPEVFFRAVAAEQAYFGFANVIPGYANITGRLLTLYANVLPAVELTGDYRLALVMTEDSVTGSSSEYAQSNAWANGKRGPMGGFENKPSPVPAGDMRYDYVARTVGSDPGGVAGCLPGYMSAGGSYSCRLQATLSPYWNRKHLNATLLLIRESDSSILNASSALLGALGVPAPQASAAMFEVYPNPADGDATVSLRMPLNTAASLFVTDVSGRIVYEAPEAAPGAGSRRISLPASGWPPGLYFVTLRNGISQQTEKLSVLH